MSDRIDLAAIRQKVTGGELQGDYLTDAEGLALVEAVEAAHAHVIARRDRLPSEWPRLLASLARFDFGDA